MNDVIWTKILHVDSVVENAVVGMAAVLGASILVYSICIVIEIIRASIARHIGKVLAGTMINIKHNNVIAKWDNIADLV